MYTLRIYYLDFKLSFCSAFSYSGSIIEDISDHWITFCQPCLSRAKTKPKSVKSRQISKDSLERFKANLQNVNWDDVTSSQDTDDCYNKFWTLYSLLFDMHFPLTIQLILTVMYTEYLILWQRGFLSPEKLNLIYWSLHLSNPLTLTRQNIRDTEIFIIPCLGPVKKFTSTIN